MPYRGTLSFTEAEEMHRPFLEEMGWINDKTPLESVALIHEEVAELGCEFRKGGNDRQAVANEMADIVLRVIGLAAEQGIDLGGAVFDKIIDNHDNIEAVRAKGRKV